MAAGPTFEPLATTTLGSAQASISFTSIPATYTDLRLVWVGSMNNNGEVWMRFNNDSATNYSFTDLVGTGSAAASSRQTSIAQANLAFYYSVGTGKAMATADVFSYAGSTYKTALCSLANDLNGSGSVEVFVNLWRSTAAINRLDVIAYTGNTFSTGTTATLYGIKSA